MSPVTRQKLAIKAMLLTFAALLHSKVHAEMAATNVSSGSPHLKPVHPFMSIETSCTADQLLVMASLQEPFFGRLYANGYASSPTCQVQGNGNHLLRLALNASECGIQLSDVEENGSRILELSLYLQYDPQFQQAVDEKFVARCLSHPAQATAEQSTTALNDIRSPLLSGLEKHSRKSDSNSPHLTAASIKAKQPFQYGSNNVSNLQALITKAANLPVTSYQATAKKAEAHREAKIPISQATVITSSALKLLPSPSQKQRDSVSCWMDIVPGTDPTGKPADSFLRVGQDATVVVRVRQAAGLDTRLTRCVVHDGSHESQQELLDADGCSLDPVIMPNVQEKVLNQSGVSMKLLYANFQAFRFPERDHLHFKCTVVVCKGKCPMSACNLIRRRGRSVTTANQLPRGRGHLGSIRQLTAKEMAEVVRPSKQQPQHIPSRTSATRNTRVSPLASSNQNGVIVDKVEVFNSVEVRSTAYSKPTNLGTQKGHSSKIVSADEKEDNSEEAIFCLTPSTLFMAFGIMFAILITAMLLAVCICIRVKSGKSYPKKVFLQQQQRQQQQQQQRCSPYSAPSTPFVSPSPLPPSTLLNASCYRQHPSAVSRSQLPINVARHGSMSPYYRTYRPQ